MKNLLFLSVAALVFASCSKDDVNGPSSGEWNGEILLSTSVGSSSSVLEANKDVAVFVNNSSDDSKLYGKTIFKVCADGSFSSQDSTKLIYPQEGAVNIYGLSDLNGVLDGNIPVGWQNAKSLNVPENNLKDYVFAKAENKEKSDKYVNLQFSKVLAKVRVAVAKRSGDFTGLIISKFSSFLKSGSIDLTTMAVNLGQDAAINSIENKFNENLNTASLQYYEALVLPQSYSENPVDLFTAIIGDEEYKYNSTGNFEAGKTYTFEFEVDKKLGALELKSLNISDWENQEEQSGSISIPAENE